MNFLNKVKNLLSKPPAYMKDTDTDGFRAARDEMKRSENKAPHFSVHKHADAFSPMIGILSDELDYVASGHFCTVWSAKEAIESRRQVALKINPAQCFTPKYKIWWYKRAQAEVFILSRLKHSNIVTFFDHAFYASEQGDLPNVLLIKTELLDCTLNQVTETIRPLSIEEMCLMAQQIGKAIQYLHNQLIVHHDIKPSNVMLTPCKLEGLNEVSLGRALPNVTYKIIDFNIARQYPPGPRHKTIEKTNFAGTPLYNAPEKDRAVAEANPGWRYNPYLSDSFAFGATLVCSLIGETALHRQSHCHSMLGIFKQYVGKELDFLTYSKFEVPIGALRTLLHVEDNGRPFVDDELLKKFEFNPNWVYDP